MAQKPITMNCTKVEILEAYTQAQADLNFLRKPLNYRRIERIEVARLLACDSAKKVAEWAMGRMIPRCMKGDVRAGDTVAALKLYCQAESTIFEDQQ